MFDLGDDSLIEQLIESGESMQSIADKWEVTTDKLKTYCKRKGITIPNVWRYSAEQARRKRVMVEAGLHQSATVRKIMRMHSSYSVRDIAEKVGCSVEYVRRMLDVHVKGEINNRHSQTVSAVQQLANSKDIPLSEACESLGIKYNSYCYSARRIGLHGHKKAPE